ncbi:MAG: M20/M25/M40 family metallo-hydrolase [Melioribacteraceae bacterium]|nr:M20/M25/M40 family metallo-hydrolase [Melioribacteraceae bacterium]MDD3558637.1 M20/M25/M40 family metallo-hydrolase [Melioribacteraceae bacterium]
MKSLFNFIFFVVISFSFVNAQSEFETGLKGITDNVVQAQLEFLASDWMEGRETGTRGNEQAADYIASMFKLYGLEPAGDIIRSYPSRRGGGEVIETPTYFQNFSLIEYSPGEDQNLSVITSSQGTKKKINFKHNVDFSVRSSSVGISIESPIVFVGYGFKSKDGDYNDFEDVNVKDKIILRLSGYPGHKDTTSEAYKKYKPEGRWGIWMLAREKNTAASEAGAIAVLEINPDADPSLNWAVNYPFRYSEKHYEGTKRLTAGVRNRMTLPGRDLSQSIITIEITERAASEILNGTKVDLEEFEKNAMNRMKPASSELKGKSIFVETTVDSKIYKVRNVLGKIEGKNPNEVIVIGGHYDHVGMNKGYIWNGSDDNASGTVGVMTIAKAFAESGIKPEKTIIFAAWTGEEKGLLGSQYFVENYEPVNNIILNLNYDMISRTAETDTLGVECSMTFTSTSPVLQETAEKLNEDIAANLKINFRGSEQPGGGSDHAPFARKDIPIFYFMAGWHDDYHQPSDHADKADINKMKNIIRLGYGMIWEFAVNGTALK